MEQYAAEHSHALNLLYLRHTENKRQGGARNTGTAVAEGEYVCFIDHDDFFLPGAFQKILDFVNRYAGLDLIMYDYNLCDQHCHTIHDAYFTANSTSPMSGPDYLLTQAIPWMPWLYLYRTKFLMEHSIQFLEKIRFEDADFVMTATANAAKMVYVPEEIIGYRTTPTQTSAIGYSVDKNIDFIKMAYRIGLLSRQLEKEKNPAWSVIMGQHEFMYANCIKKNLWRLPYKHICHILRTYPPVSSQGPLLSLAHNHPDLLALLTTCATPLLKSAYWLYSKIK